MVKELKLKATLQFHNLINGGCHHLYDIIKFNTGITPEFIGWNRGKRVIKLNDVMYKVTKFDTYTNESWVTLKKFTGNAEPKNDYEYDEQNDKIKNELSTDYFIW